MPRANFEIRFNRGPGHAEHDWLVFKDGRFVTGFAASNAAQRFVDDAEAEARIDAQVSRAERRRLARLIPAVIE